MEFVSVTDLAGFKSMTPVYPIEKALRAQDMAIAPIQPQPDDAVLGGQSAAPIDGAVLGGIEGVKQRFEVGDFEQKKQALEDALRYGDRQGLEFLRSIFERKLPKEIRDYARKLWIEGQLQRPGPIDLRGLDLSTIDLRQVSLKGADLSQADLSLADLRGVDLRGANLRRANLMGVDLRGANLAEANLHRAKISRSTKMIGYIPQNKSIRQDAPLDYLGMGHLRRADLREVRLTKADLTWADLRDVDLSKADLREADLGWAKLKAVDLTGADLRGARVNRYTEIDQRWQGESWWKLLVQVN